MRSEGVGPEDWRNMYEDARMTYEITLKTISALPVDRCIKCADQLYSDLHFADQLRQKAVKMMEG